MTTPTIPATWFEMPEIARRRVADNTWIPLRASQTNQFDNGGEETFALGSIAFPQQHKAAAENLSWSELGIGHSGGPYAYKTHPYKIAEVYQYHDGQDMGVDLIFEQYPNNGCERVWHINQDLLLALNLVREGTNWVSPDEGFVTVIREMVDPNGLVCSIEIRAEFLKDYLAARGLSLRLAYYRQRVSTLDDATHIPWRTKGLERDQPHDRFSAGVYEVDENGGPFGAGVAVLHLARTDVYPDDDVPIFDEDNSENTVSTSTRFNRAGRKFFRVEGELWREEWVEPSTRSERVRGDEPAELITYLIDASGTRVAHPKLNDERIGRYLWFSPEIMTAIRGIRNGGHRWYTRDTGSVWATQSWPVHFGVNGLNLINVYAYDIAKLPVWQQRIWAGYNVPPDGGVSGELLQAQMKGTVASTDAPEDRVLDAMRSLDQAVMRWLGSPLFREHEAVDGIITSISRFRGLEHNGILALAKDLARVIVDRIDIGPLQLLMPSPRGEKWGSLKSLEKALTAIVPAEDARSLLTSLVGIYELRVGDAHLPSGKIEEAFRLAGIDKDAKPLAQCFEVIDIAASALCEIRDAILKQVSQGSSEELHRV